MTNTVPPVIRPVANVVRGQATSDGAGVKLSRVVGTQALPQVDPFLLLDEFGSDDPQAYIAGFPDHPHRGFETITYMLAGRMRHRDSKGHEGLLEAGGAQWMTAARGLVHSEMPEQEHGLLRGFQFWLNLPAAEKMEPAHYQDIPAARIPSLDKNGVRVTVVAGRFDGAVGPVAPASTDPLILDMVFPPEGGILDIPVSASHAGFVYVCDGTARIGDREVGRGQAAVLGAGDTVRLATDREAHLLLAAGRPLGEPIVRHGPFVMNTREEIYQAFADYEAGLFLE